MWVWILNEVWPTARSQKLASYADILRALLGAECPKENSLRVAAIPLPPPSDKGKAEIGSSLNKHVVHRQVRKKKTTYIQLFFDSASPLFQWFLLKNNFRTKKNVSILQMFTMKGKIRLLAMKNCLLRTCQQR